MDDFFEKLFDMAGDVLHDYRKMAVVSLLIIVVLGLMVRSCANRMNSLKTVAPAVEKTVVVRQERGTTELEGPKKTALSLTDFPQREPGRIHFTNAHEVRVFQREFEESEAGFRDNLAAKGGKTD